MNKTSSYIIVVMKKYLWCISFLVALCSIQIKPVLAEEDFSDTSYWNQLCTNTSSLSQEEQASCQAYIQHMREANASLQEEMNTIDQKKSEIIENINAYASQIGTYNATISSLNDMINDLNVQVKAVEGQLVQMEETYQANQEAIKQKQEDMAELEERARTRMVERQKTMRINPYIDIIFGAKSFNDFYRILNAIKDINEADAHLEEELNNGVKELNEMNEQLLIEQEQLEALKESYAVGMETLHSQQTTLLASKYEAELIRQTYQNEYNEVLDEITDAQSTVSTNQATIDNINQSIEDSNRPTPTPEVIVDQPTEDNTASQSETTDTQTADNSSTSSSGPTQGDSSGNPYYGGWSNCTWGAWQLVHDTLGISLPNFGWSTNWLANAAALGYPTGSEPQVYSVAVYENHVAFVTAVNGDQVYIKEGNYLGNYMERWVSKDVLPWTGQRCLGYIYL